MTPKIKAEELIEKFKEYAHGISSFNGKYNESVEINSAKQCAIICADEIIHELEQLRKPEYTSFVIQNTNSSEENSVIDGYEKKDFWNEVKSELENL